MNDDGIGRNMQRRNSFGSIWLSVAWFSYVSMAQAAESPLVTPAEAPKAWLTIEQFLEQAPPAPAPAPAVPAGALVLPSLTEAAVNTATEPPKPPKAVEFAALPPLFERTKPVPDIEKPKLNKSAPKLVAEVVVPTAEVKSEAACTTPEQAKAQNRRAKNYASDSETLKALQQAVQSLGEGDKLDFLVPQTASLTTPAKSPARAAP